MTEVSAFSIEVMEIKRSLIEKHRCEQSLSAFIKAAWHVIEPAQPYIHGWHIDAICMHLEAITDGREINGDVLSRLLVNIPPGTMKSLCIGVFWPAWEWGPRNMPHMRYVCCSHSQSLAIRDNVKARRLVGSEWYQEHWGDRVQLTADQNSKLKFENTRTGFREAAAAGSITGSRGDRVIIDDPLSVEDAASQQIRLTTKEWFLEAVPTRLNNPVKSAIIVVMQRLHEEDTSGVILENKLPYVHLCLPMRYEAHRPCSTPVGFKDMRADGELLFPERFPEKVVARDEFAMGEYATAGQFQQSPVPRGGGILKREWWQGYAAKTYPRFEYVFASVDTAYTEKQENDPSACTVWGVWNDATGQPSLMMLFAWEGRAAFHELLTTITDIADGDPKRLLSKGGLPKSERVLIENKASGHSLAQEMRRVLGRGLDVQMFDPRAQDKTQRVHSISYLFSEGLIYVPVRPDPITSEMKPVKWAQKVIDQCASFPKAAHDDLCDTVSQALIHARNQSWLLRKPEHLDEVRERITLKRNTEPLYDA